MVGPQLAQWYVTIAHTNGSMCLSSLITNCFSHLSLLSGMALVKTTMLMNLSHHVSGLPCGVVADLPHGVVSPAL